MTIDERKRARELKNVSKAYAGRGGMTAALIVSLLFVLLIAAIVILGGMWSDELYILPLALGAALPFTHFVVMTDTAGIGDSRNMMYRQNKAPFTGAPYEGHFLSTLPFRARDLLNLRLIQWEITAAVNVLLMTAAQVFCMIMEHRGHEMPHGFGGIAILILIAGEIFMAVLTLMQKNFWRVTKVLAIIVFLLWLMPSGWDASLESGFEKIIGTPFVEIFYGIPGIITLTICTILIGIIAELHIKRKEFSWNLH